MEPRPDAFRRPRRRSRVQMGVVIFTCFPTVALAGSSALERAEPQQDSPRKESALLDIVQEALADASRPLQPVRRERNTQSRWGPRFKKVRKSISKFATSILFTSSAVSHSSLTTVEERDYVKSNASVLRFRESSRRRKPELPHSTPYEDIETVEGARLVSASFGLIANAFGLIADGVRISGDTAAGVMGSSIKLMGSTVVSMSSNFEGAGRILEPKTDVVERRKILTSERMRERQSGKRMDQDEEVYHVGLWTSTRSVAARSVKLVGSVVRGVGDTLLLAGAATETIASSTTGVVEDAVRIGEDFAGSVSHALSPENYRRIKTNVIIDSPRADEEPRDSEDESDASYVSFGSYDDAASEADDMESPTASNIHGQKDGFTIPMLDLGLQTLWHFLMFITTDTQGVPSFAAELLGVIILCYIAALWQLSSMGRIRRPIVNNAHMIPDDDVSSLSSHEDSGVQEASPAGSQNGAQGQTPLVEEKEESVDLMVLVAETLFLPFKLLFFLLSLCRRVLFDRRTVLFVTYGGAWVYLCRASQLRSTAIQRNSEAYGYRTAIDSIGSSTSQSISESVIWLNAILSQIWRVRYDSNTKEGAKWKNLSREYPKFVRRAIRSNTYGRMECRACEWEVNEDIHYPVSCLPYGGLEPYISGNIGTLLLEALQGSKASRHNDVAYTSLYSFTLGHKPPLLRSIELLGTVQEGRKLHFHAEVDAILEDLSLVLDVKLSSLDYALLPSTKVSIHAIDVTLPLRMSVSVRPDYPYVSMLELSLSKAPICNIRITPLSGQSGLRGVDVGSLPVIREWIQDVIRITLSEYVTPNYIAIDIAAWLATTPVTTIPSQTIPDITQLRQKTRVPVNPNPRTSSPEGVTITSVADTLPSHSVSSTAFVQGDRKKDAAFHREKRTDQFFWSNPQQSYRG